MTAHQTLTHTQTTYKKTTKLVGVSLSGLFAGLDGEAAHLLTSRDGNRGGGGGTSHLVPAWVKDFIGSSEVILAKIKPPGWIINQGKSDRDTRGGCASSARRAPGRVDGRVKPFNTASVVYSLITRSKKKSPPPPSLPPSHRGPAGM